MYESFDTLTDAPDLRTMAKSTIYTRAYSKSSAGQLVSSKGPKGGPLSDKALLQEFRNHANRWSPEPTALVSGSDRIVDTLKRAFDKRDEDGDEPAEIWIAFIEVPPTTNKAASRIHSAQKLAAKCEFPEPYLFSHEVVFEWAIPEKYLLHKVNLQTLIERGLQENWFLQRSTVDVRRDIASKLHGDSLWELGIALGSFARNFGARAPLNWIAYQLFYDCVWAETVHNDMVRLHCTPEHTEIVDLHSFCELDDGIDTSLYEWWLSDIAFFLDYEAFKERREVIEDRISWDLIRFWEIWDDVDYDGTVKELSAKNNLSYDEQKKKLLVEHEKKRADIEAEAVMIGL